MRLRTAALIAAVLTLALSSAALASPRSELKGVDSESALRRTRKDATWLRQASVRQVKTPAVLNAGSSDLSEQLDHWFKRDRTRPSEPSKAASTASNTPRR